MLGAAGPTADVSLDDTDDGLLLAGDDLITDGGVSGAVVDGSEGALARYQETRDEIATTLFEVTDEIASFEWDLPTVKELHLKLSEEMKREVRIMDERRQPTPAPIQQAS